MSANFVVFPIRIMMDGGNRHWLLTDKHFGIPMVLGKPSIKKNIFLVPFGTLALTPRHPLNVPFHHFTIYNFKALSGINGASKKKSPKSA